MVVICIFTESVLGHSELQSRELFGDFHSIGVLTGMTCVHHSKKVRKMDEEYSQTIQVFLKYHPAVMCYDPYIHMVLRTHRGYITHN